MATWDSVSEFEVLRRQMERTLANLAGQAGGGSRRVAFLPGLAARQYPLLNVHEDQTNVYVEALAPGVDPKTLELTVEQNVLTVKGEKPGLSSVTAEAYHRNERAAGRFVRSVELNAAVDRDRVHADYRNGLLLITLPKSQAARPRQITVNVA